MENYPRPVFLLTALLIAACDSPTAPEVDCIGQVRDRQQCELFATTLGCETFQYNELGLQRTCITRRCDTCGSLNNN